MPTAWCTRDDIVDILSEEGVTWATDDNRDGLGDTAQVTNAIERARVWFMQYLGKFYESDAIAGTSWGKWNCARRAAIELMRRRGEQVAIGLLAWQAEMDEYLKLVMSGNAQLPDVTKINETGSVAWTNVTHDLRPTRKQIRQIPDTSSQPNTILPIPGLINPRPDMYP